MRQHFDGVLLGKLTQSHTAGIGGFPHGERPEFLTSLARGNNCGLLFTRLYAIFSRDMNESFKSLWDRVGGQESLARLLRHFYADIRQHQLVGLVFNKQIEDWPTHLETIQSFWARMIGGPSRYSGQMPAKHFALGLSAIHFRAWLQLWEFNCRAYLNKNEAEEMISLAHEIGRRLQVIIGVTRREI
jgi:hemoglobin